MTFSALYPRTTNLFAAIIQLACLIHGNSYAGQDEPQLSKRPALVLYSVPAQQIALETAAARYGFLIHHVKSFSGIATDLHVLGRQRNFDSRRVYRMPDELAPGSGVNWNKLLNRRLDPFLARELRHAITANRDVSKLLIDVAEIGAVECRDKRYCVQGLILAKI